MIFIVTTPVLNGARFIDETILSVVSQAGPFRLRYHVQDAGSSDGTLEKLAAWKRLLDGDFPVLCDSVEFSFSSEPDRGLYDGIDRGFRGCFEGSVMSWINSDDRYEQGAFASAAQILASFPDILWLCGRGAIIDEESALVYSRPFTLHPRRSIDAGIFDGRFAPTFIMQEGVFWRSSLWERSGGLNTSFKLAGDYDLWRRFSANTDLVIADSVFGYFRSRKGQLSENKLPYWAELDASLDRVQKRRRRLHAVLYHFGFMTYRIVARDCARVWTCKTIYAFKFGCLFRLVTKTSRPVQKLVGQESEKDYSKP